MSAKEAKEAIRDLAKRIGHRPVWLALVTSGLGDSTSDMLVRGDHQKEIHDRTYRIILSVLSRDWNQAS